MGAKYLNAWVFTYILLFRFVLFDGPIVFLLLFWHFSKISKFFKFFRLENWFELEYILRIWNEISNKLFFSLSFGRCPQTSSEKFIFGYLDIFSHRNTFSIFLWWYSRKWRGRPLWIIQMGRQPRYVLVLIWRQVDPLYPNLTLT